MYFYQILHACEEAALTKEFLKLCTDSPDLHHTQKIFQEFLKHIKNLQPEISEEWTLFMRHVQNDAGEDYEHVYAKNSHDSQSFGIIAVPWKKILGWHHN